MSERAQALEAALRECFETIAGWRIATMGAHQAHVGQFGTDHLARIAAVLAAVAPPVGVSPQPPVRDMGEADEYGNRICDQCGQQVQRRHRCAMEPASLSPVEPTPNDMLLRNIRMAAAMGLSFGHQSTPQPLERMVERKDKRLRQILTLLAEHGITGSMLRAESNIAVEPTPEPPRKAKPICPNCGSTDVGEDGHETNGPAGWQGTGDLVCGACEHVWTPDLPSVEPAPPTPVPCVWRVTGGALGNWVAPSCIAESIPAPWGTERATACHLCGKPMEISQ